MEKYKKIFYMILGGIVFTTVGVLADNIIYSSDVIYNNTSGITDSNGDEITDVQAALNELYDRTDGGSSYTITFDAQNDTENTTAPSYQTYGTLPTPTKTGYYFVGWFLSDGTTQITSETEITENTTLHAHWTPVAN